MKTRLWWVLAMIFGSLIMGSALSAQAPASPAAEEEEPEVIGVQATRPDGKLLGLAVEGNAFVLRFYDAEKEELAPDVPRAVASWNAVQQSGRQRVVLNPSGKALTSPPRVRPPYAFIAYVTLLTEDGSTVESHTFNIRDQ